MNTVKEKTLSIHCPKDELLKGIQTVQSAISTRSTLPALSHVLFEVTENGLRLSATDLEVGIRCHVKADVKSEGSVTVPARTLLEFLRTLEEGKEIGISVDSSHKMDIRSGRDHCVLSGLPKEDYPVLPDFGKESSFSIPRQVLREMMRKTIFAVSSDETRYVLNGVNFLVSQGVLIMVATDGRRLAYISRNSIDKKASASSIIPSKAVNEVLRVTAEGKGEGSNGKGDVVEVVFTENQVAFKIGDVVVLSRLIEGHFPSYEQVIPKAHEQSISLPRKKIFLATQRAAVGTLEKGGSVRYALSKNSLRIWSQAVGRVEVESEIDIRYSGPPMEVAFNPTYVLDVLKNIEEDEVILELTAPLNPGVIRPPGDDTYRYVIMPMKI